MTVGLSDLQRLESLKPRLDFRSRFSRYLREFFFSRGFLEVETPVRVLAPAPEDHINAPPAQGGFLRASPELHMKRLVAAGYERVFQLGPCFRQGEIGRRHNEEFTMLEWYWSGADYDFLAGFLKDALTETLRAVTGKTAFRYRDRTIDLAGPWETLTVREAFAQFAGVSPELALKDDLFEILLTEKVEPALSRERPVILKDYPKAQAALARLKPDDPTLAERWELYIGGVELANAYSELTDPDEQRRRFDAAAARRAEQGLPAYPDDPDFFAALRRGVPPFTGCALGFDRLIMVLTDAETIAETIAFPGG